MKSGGIDPKSIKEIGDDPVQPGNPEGGEPKPSDGSGEPAKPEGGEPKPSDGGGETAKPEGGEPKPSEGGGEPAKPGGSSLNLNELPEDKLKEFIDSSDNPLIAGFREKAKKAEELEKAMEDYRKKREELGGDLNENEAKLLKQLRSGHSLEEIAKFSSIDPDSMSDRDWAEIDVRERYGSDIDQSMVDQLLRRDYGIGYTEDELEDLDQDKRLDFKVRLLDAKKSGRKIIEERKQEINQADPSKVFKDKIKEYRDQMGLLEETVKKEAANLRPVTVNLDKDGQNQFSTETNLAPELKALFEQKSYAPAALFRMVSDAPDIETQMHEFMQAVAFWRNKDKIAQDIATKVASETEDRIDAEYNNGSRMRGDRSGNQGPASGFKSEAEYREYMRKKGEEDRKRINY